MYITDKMLGKTMAAVGGYIVVVMAGELDPYQWMNTGTRDVYVNSTWNPTYGNQYFLRSCRPVEILKGIDTHVLLHYRGWSRHGLIGSHVTT